MTEHDLMNPCVHNWRIVVNDPGSYRLEKCTRCDSCRDTNLRTGHQEIMTYLPDGQVQIEGKLYCGHCGMSFDEATCNHRIVCPHYRKAIAKRASQ